MKFEVMVEGWGSGEGVGVGLSGGEGICLPWGLILRFSFYFISFIFVEAL